MAEPLDLVELHQSGGYGSEFEYDSEAEKKRARRRDLIPEHKSVTSSVASKRVLDEEFSKEEGRKQRYHFLSLDAFSRHKQYINNYLLYYGGSRTEFKRDSSLDKTDFDVIRENHKFLWNEEDEEEDTWEKRLAKKYYDKLFKEYCITDLSRYKENKIAMRWRIEKEVMEGKGQFSCGNKKCSEGQGLRSWEVNFGYLEHGEKKNALVKLRLCPECSRKLNYHHKRKEVRKEKTSSKVSSKEPKAKKHRHAERGKAEENDDQQSSRSSSEEDATREVSSSNEKDDTPEDAEKDIWKGPVKIEEEKSREEEFDSYFEDMFL